MELIRKNREKFRSAWNIPSSGTFRLVLLLLIIFRPNCYSLFDVVPIAFFLLYRAKMIFPVDMLKYKTVKWTVYFKNREHRVRISYKTVSQNYCSNMHVRPIYIKYYSYVPQQSEIFYLGKFMQNMIKVLAAVLNVYQLMILICYFVYVFLHNRSF